MQSSIVSVLSDSERPQEKNLFHKTKILADPQEVIQMVLDKHGINLVEIKKPLQKRFGLARREAMFLLRYRCHLPYAKIGMMMGGVQDSAVEKTIRKYKEGGGWKVET